MSQPQPQQAWLAQGADQADQQQACQQQQQQDAAAATAGGGCRPAPSTPPPAGEPPGEQQQQAGGLCQADQQQDQDACCCSDEQGVVFLRRVTFSDDHTTHTFQPSSSAGDLAAGDTAEDDERGPQQRRRRRGTTEPRPGCWPLFKAQVRALKAEVLALYYAVHHADTPLAARLLPLLVLGYALSPLDLIPDFIPVLGLVDDMLLLPAGLWLSLKLIPPHVMAECRAKAAQEPLRLAHNWLAAVLVFACWTCGLLLLVHWLVNRFGDDELRGYEWAVLAGAGGVAAILFALWLVATMRHEARQRCEWNAALLGAQHDADGDDAA